jgi:hypothetical protein
MVDSDKEDIKKVVTQVILEGRESLEIAFANIISGQAADSTGTLNSLVYKPAEYGRPIQDYPSGHSNRPKGLYERHKVPDLVPEQKGITSLPDWLLELVRDASYYRALRKMHWDDSPYCVVSDPKANVKLGRYCPSGENLDQVMKDYILKGGK